MPAPEQATRPPGRPAARTASRRRRTYLRRIDVQAIAALIETEAAVGSYEPPVDPSTLAQAADRV